MPKEDKTEENEPKETEPLEELPSSDSQQSEDKSKAQQDWISSLIESVVPLVDKYITQE